MFLDWIGKKQKNVSQVTYNDIVKYVGHLKKRNLTPKTINSDLIAIRYFLDSLGMKNNPVGNIRVKGQVKTIPNNVLSEKQLIKLYTDFKVDDKKPSSLRDKVIVGLMVFQGLRTGNLQQLKVSDVNFEKATVQISAQSSRNKRTLNLDPLQMIDLHKYISESRNELLIQSQKQSDLLLISGGESQRIRGVIQRLIKRILNGSSEVISYNQITSSVYSLWLTKHNLREVQYMAGHKYVSSIERYKKADLRGLQKELTQFYPNF